MNQPSAKLGTSSVDAEARYQQPRAVVGRLLRGVACARRPVGLCNGKMIDAENERGGIAVPLLLDGAEAQPTRIVEIRELIVGIDDRARLQAPAIGGNVRIDEFVQRVGKIHLS